MPEQHLIQKSTNYCLEFFKSKEMDTINASLLLVALKKFKAKLKIKNKLANFNHTKNLSQKKL